jgi:hypothetical protein
MSTLSYVDIGAIQRKEGGSPAPNTSYVDIGAAQRQETTVTAYTLTADAGSYAVTGTSVTFPITRKVIAASGAYLITGTAATLTATMHTHYTLSVLSGSYLITGTRATLRWSGAPPVTGNFPQCLNIAVMGL